MKLTENELEARLQNRADLLASARAALSNINLPLEKEERVCSAARRFESTPHDSELFLEAGFGLLAAIQFATVEAK